VFWQRIEVLRYPEASIHGSSESYTRSNRRTGALSLPITSLTSQLFVTFSVRGLGNHLAPQRTSNGYLDVIEEALTRRVNAAKEELRKILEDEKCPPLTFNHYYTLTIQKARRSKRKRDSAENEGPNGTPNEQARKDWNADTTIRFACQSPGFRR
jgi:hypothetical protein